MLPWVYIPTMLPWVYIPTMLRGWYPTMLHGWYPTMLHGCYSPSERCYSPSERCYSRPREVIPVHSGQVYSRFRPVLRAFPFLGYSLGCLRFITRLTTVLHLLAEMVDYMGPVKGFGTVVGGINPGINLQIMRI